MKRLKKIEKIWQYIKENKLYIAVMIIGSFAFLFQMKQVVLYADDFALGIISQDGMKAIWEYFKNNYMNWGGGLTCLIATTFLLFKIGVWKIFQSAIVIITVILITKMVTHERKKNKALVASIIWLCIYILNIWISREVLYWLDGGLAYEFTAFQIFVYFYYLYTRMHLKIHKKYDKILLPVVAFFAGWSSAQTGPIAVLLPIIFIIWEKLIKKEKVSKFYYITTILGVIGFAIFYFAPGNAARMNISFEEYASYNLIQKILYRVDGVYGLIFDFETYQFTGVPFYMLLLLGLNGIIGFSMFNKENEQNKKIRFVGLITATIQLAFAVVCLAIALKVPNSEILAGCTIKFQNILQAKQQGILTIKMLIPYGITSIVMLSIIVESYLIALKTKNPILVITLISGLIMQGVMVMAPYSPLRTTYYTIMFLWIAIAYLIHFSLQKDIKIGIVAILVFAMYNLGLGIVALILYGILKSIRANNKKEMNVKYEIGMMIGIMLIMAIANYGDIIKNYAINKDIYHQNIARIEEYKEEQEKGVAEEELYLLLPKEEKYGFTPMVGIEWVENAIKEYFGLENVILKAENKEEL